MILILLFSSGCFYPSEYNNPVAYPTVSVVSMHWIEDGSGVIVLELVQDSNQGPTYGRVVLYDRTGALLRSVHTLPEIDFSNNTFLETQGNRLLTWSGYRVDVTNGVGNQLNFLPAGSRIVSVSPSARYLIEYSSNGYGLYELSSQRALHQWYDPNGSPSSSIAWQGDSLYGSIGLNSSGIAKLFVRDTSFAIRDSFDVSNSPVASAAKVFWASGSYYVADSLGLLRLSHGSAGTRVVASNATQAALSNDASVALFSAISSTQDPYCPSCILPKFPASLILANVQTGKTLVLADSVLSIALAPTGDRAAYTKSLDYYHDKVFVVPVSTL